MRTSPSAKIGFTLPIPLPLSPPPIPQVGESTGLISQTTPSGLWPPLAVTHQLVIPLSRLTASPSPELTTGHPVWQGSVVSDLAYFPAHPLHSNEVPSWARVAWEGGNANPLPLPTVMTAEFITLYERCMTSGLRTCVAFSYSVGYQKIFIFCCLTLPYTAAVASAGATTAAVAIVYGPICHHYCWRTSNATNSLVWIPTIQTSATTTITTATAAAAIYNTIWSVFGSKENNTTTTLTTTVYLTDSKEEEKGREAGLQGGAVERWWEREMDLHLSSLLFTPLLPSPPPPSPSELPPPPTPLFATPPKPPKREPGSTRK